MGWFVALCGSGCVVVGGFASFFVLGVVLGGVGVYLCWNGVCVLLT